jgi:RNA polymerase sigma factor (sigma-70 family)
LHWAWAQGYGRREVAVSAPPTPFARYGDHHDRALAARAGRGDEQAFAELYDRHAAGLLAFATQYVGDRAAAEDVVQQTFMAAYRELSDGTELHHPRAWLYRVARNNALTMIRDRGPASVDADLAADLQDRAAAVPAQVERREALQEVVRDIVALPPEQRAALALYELGDLSQAEIADALGCKPARVKALVFQARSSLLTQREARDASCETVREKLATFHGGALNHRLIRHHLRGCDACRAYRDELRDQRRRVALLLPVLPLPGLRESVLGLFGGGAAATATTGTAGSAALLRPGRLRWLAAGAAKTAVVAGITLATWPSGDAPHKVPVRAVAATPSMEPPVGPSVRAARVARHTSAPVHHAAPHRAARPQQSRRVRTAARAPVAQTSEPNPPNSPRPPRSPAAAPKPVPTLKPKPTPKPTPAPVAPAPTAATAPAPGATPAPLPPSPAPCADHSHASQQGLAHGQGHSRCKPR